MKMATNDGTSNSSSKEVPRSVTGLLLTGKPLECDICGAKMARSHDLKIHRRKHTGEKPFTCEWCGRMYSRRDKMKVHQRKEHKLQYEMQHGPVVDGKEKARKQKEKTSAMERLRLSRQQQQQKQQREEAQHQEPSVPLTPQQQLQQLQRQQLHLVQEQHRMQTQGYRGTGQQQ